MKKIIRNILAILLVIVVVSLAINLIQSGNVDVLNPKGTIADQQRNLIVFTVALSAVVVIPVFFLLFFISWKYREGNPKTVKYTPDKDHNTVLEIIWWGIPCIIILVLSLITWKTSHELDPYKALESDTKPITVQVVALQWKWLFLYPEEQIASVNLVQFPEKTPINFVITADAPMNSFWIPSLGGQVYAMTGMSTKLHLMADTVGTYNGSSANISGEGFSKMKFKAVSTSRVEFDDWVRQTKRSDRHLDTDSYKTLAEPSTEDQPLLYALENRNLYDTIVMKYMMPDSHGHDTKMPAMEGM